MVWGPAEFTGLPPRMLIGEGLCAGVLGTGLITGAGFFGAWTGKSAFAAGDVGLMCALGLVLYLLLVRAGRAMVGIVAVLAVGLALHTPSSARTWRGCTRSTRPGDALALVYDPKGLVPPRGVEGATSVTDVLRSLAGWVAGLVVACVIAVVRSFRLLDHPVAPGSDRPGGQGATSTERP
ncbi:hypothetical protein ACFYZ3_29885 [Streptomyces sp. NPDC001599]|uniref:hypothetical protein n=1 Tax=Streptomyces sp. NPDC001599 TaxID=3364591 RepID=UPI00368ADF8A